MRAKSTSPGLLVQYQKRSESLNPNPPSKLFKRYDLDCLIHGQEKLMLRRLNNQLDPSTGLNDIPSKLSQSYQFQSKVARKEDSGTAINSRIIENWLINALNDAEITNLPNQLQQDEQKRPLAKYRIDRTILASYGLTKPRVDRLYKAMFVYSIGLYQEVTTLVEHIQDKYQVIASFWKVYAILLEYCFQVDFKMIVNQLNVERNNEILILKQNFEAQLKMHLDNEKQLSQNIEALKRDFLIAQEELDKERFKRKKLEEEIQIRGLNHEEEVNMRLKFAHNLNELHAKVKMLDNENYKLIQEKNQLIIQRNQLQESKNKKEIQIQEISKKFYEADQLYKDQQIDVIRLDSQVKSLTIKFDRQRDTQYTLKQQIYDMKAEIMSLKGQVLEYETLISQITSERDNLQEKTIQLQDVIQLNEGNYKTTIQQEESKNLEMIKSYQNARKQTIEKHAQLQKYQKLLIEEKKKLQDQVEMYNKLETQLDIQHQHNEDMQQEIYEFQEKCQNLDTTIQMLQVGKQLLDENIGRLNQRIDKLQLKLRRKDSEIKDIQKINVGLKNEIDEQHKKYQQLYKEFQTEKQNSTFRIQILDEKIEQLTNLRQEDFEQYEKLSQISQEKTEEIGVLNQQIEKNKMKLQHLKLQSKKKDSLIQQVKEYQKEGKKAIIEVQTDNNQKQIKIVEQEIMISQLITAAEENKQIWEQKVLDYENQIQQQLQEFNLKRERVIIRFEDILTVQAIAYQKLLKKIEKIKKLKQIIVQKNGLIQEFRVEVMDLNQQGERARMKQEDLIQFYIKENSLRVQAQQLYRKLQNDYAQTRQKFKIMRQSIPKEYIRARNPIKEMNKVIEDLKQNNEYLQTQVKFYEDKLCNVTDQQVQATEQLNDQETNTELDHTFFAKLDQVSRSKLYRNDDSKDSLDNVQVDWSVLQDAFNFEEKQLSKVETDQTIEMKLKMREQSYIDASPETIESLRQLQSKRHVYSNLDQYMSPETIESLQQIQGLKDASNNSEDLTKILEQQRQQFNQTPKLPEIGKRLISIKRRQSPDIKKYLNQANSRRKHDFSFS